MGFNFPTNQKKYRWGSQRDKMLFSNFFMSWAAAKYYDEVFEPIIRSSAMADLQKFRRKIINTISSSSSESEQIAFEVDKVGKRTLTDLVNRNVTEEEISNSLVNNSVVKLSDKFLRRIFIYNPNNKVYYESYDGNTSLIDANPTFKINTTHGQQWGFQGESRSVYNRGRSSPLSDYTLQTYLSKNFANNLVRHRIKTSDFRYSDMRKQLENTSPWIKEAVNFIIDDLPGINKRTYQLDQTIRYNQMEVEIISMRDRININGINKNHWARRFITRDNFKSVYLADPKSGYESTILKVT
jgi:hypothetical protein